MSKKHLWMDWCVNFIRIKLSGVPISAKANAEMLRAAREFIAAEAESDRLMENAVSPWDATDYSKAVEAVQQKFEILCQAVRAAEGEEK